MKQFSHLDHCGQVKMVDVSQKNNTRRQAIAVGEISMDPDVIEKIKSMAVAKGNVLETARLAGIMAAKKTDQIVPLCHTLNIESIGVEFEMDEKSIKIRSHVICEGKTGVEMEALTATMVAGLTIYDMCKALDKSMIIGPFFLERKSGGRSGLYERNRTGGSL